MGGVESTGFPRGCWQDAWRPNLLEVLEGELVHGIDLGEACYDKVQDGATRGHRSIALPGRVDLQLGGLGLLQALLDGF